MHWRVKEAYSAVSTQPPQDPQTAFGPNEWLVDELYQDFLRDKNLVDKSWWRLFEDYHPDVATAVAEVLQAQNSDELEVLLVLTIDGDLYGATANLRAPVVLSRTRGTAVQVVLDDDSLSMQEPLFRGAA